MTLTKLLALIALVACMWLMGYLMGKIEQQKRDEEDFYDR